MARVGGRSKAQPTPRRITRAELDVLVRKHQGLIHLVIRKSMLEGMDYDDLVQEGNLGLVMAAERYDPSRGEFLTYAMFWVKARVWAAINKYVESESMERVGVHRRGSEKKPRSRRVISIEEVSVRDRLSDERDDLDETVISVLDGEIDRDRLYAALATLTRREREVITRRFLTTNSETLQDVGERQGCSRERIRQIQARALTKLRAFLEGE